MFNQHCGYWWPGALAQGISSRGADYAPMPFPVFKGYVSNNSLSTAAGQTAQ